MFTCYFYPQDYIIFYRYKQYEEFQKEGTGNQTQTILPFGKTVVQYGESDHRQKKLAKSIALNLVFDCGQPFSIVERPGWFINEIEPKYRNVDR